MNSKKIIFSITALIICGLSFGQSTQIRGFANVDIIGDFIKKDSLSGGNRNHFALGQYDFFVTSQVTEKISFLGESVFEYDDGFLVDVERIIVKYQLDDHFDFAVGKFHTPLGYWNNAYHHGTVLQPTTIRPEPVRFEDEGGILPIHETGLEISGEHFTDLNLGFNLLLSNGIAASPVDDINQDKAISANIHAEPVENFKVIVSGFYDKIPPGVTNPQGNYVPLENKMMILNGSLVYLNPNSPLEIIGEYYYVKNKMDFIGDKATSAFIGYAGYKIKKYTPYVAFNTIMYETGEKYFTENDVYTVSAGLRYQTSSLSVIKFEFNYSKPEFTDAHSIVKLQFAIGF